MAREDFRRIQVAALSRPEWFYVVLTLDPRNHRNAATAYADASALWRDRLQERLQRMYGRLEYVQTWEQHANGFPHVNVLLRSDAMLEHVHELGFENRTVSTPKGERTTRFAFWRTAVLAKLVPECGFGRRVWGEPVVCAQSMASYFAKIVGEFCRAAEKPGDQRPISAPFGTRRLRASHGLLPPRKRSTGEWGGVVVDAPLAAFLDQDTGEIGASWSDVERAARLAQAIRAGYAKMDERAAQAAAQWARDRADFVVHRWGDDGFGRNGLTFADCLDGADGE